MRWWWWLKRRTSRRLRAVITCTTFGMVMMTVRRHLSGSGIGSGSSSAWGSSREGRSSRERVTREGLATVRGVQWVGRPRRRRWRQQQWLLRDKAKGRAVG